MFITKLVLPFFLLATAVAPSRCNKDNAVKKTKTEFLTQHVWQLDEVSRSIEGKNSYYIRGGKNTTGVSYDRLQLSFQMNGSGTYTDENGIVHQTVWQFTSADENNLELKVGPPYSTTFQWNLVEVTDKALHNTTLIGNNILVSARYVPIQ